MHITASEDHRATWISVRLSLAWKVSPTPYEMECYFDFCAGPAEEEVFEAPARDEGFVSRLDDDDDDDGDDNDDDDQIDSVSVISERRAHGDSRSMSRSSSTFSINQGRGRAVLLARRGISTPSTNAEVFLPPEEEGDAGGFSILREANIHPRRTGVHSRTNSALSLNSQTPAADGDDSRIALLEKLRSDAVMETLEAKKPKGRGRGQLLRRS